MKESNTQPVLKAEDCHDKLVYMKCLHKSGTVAAWAVFLFLPAIAFGGTTDAINKILEILNRIVPLIFAVALIWLLWSLTQFFLVSENETKRETVLKQIIYIVIVLTVMVSIWGLVAIAQRTFGLDSETSQHADLPQV